MPDETPPDDHTLDAPPQASPADAVPQDAAPSAPVGLFERFRRRAEPAPGSAPNVSAEDAVTQGGYSYELVRERDDDPATHGAEVSSPSESSPSAQRHVPLGRLAVGAGALLLVVLIAAGAWYLLTNLDGDSGDERVRGDVANLVGLFSQGDAVAVSRFEGELPAGFPEDVPTYPDGKLIASIRQIGAENASYLVVYDSEDSRDEVARYFADKLGEDPWQVEAGQDGRDSTLHQFSRTDDSEVTGVVFATESEDTDVTTILLSVQVQSGADAAEPEPFDPGDNKSLPENFPEDVPQYPGSTAIESAFQKQAGERGFAVSLVTTDDQSDVLDFYRERFGDNGWTVEDADPGESPLEGAEAIGFSGGDPEIEGQILVGELAEDQSYTRIEIQVRQPSQSGG